jgi:hypothetical protein
MSTETDRIPNAWRGHHGAESTAVICVTSISQVVQWRRSQSAVRSGIAAFGERGLVASFGAPLRSSSRVKLEIASTLVTHRRVAVRSARAQLHPVSLLESASQPNNSLVPTLVSKAHLGSVGPGAAQFNR